MLDSRENLLSQLLQTALQYRARGWSVLPVRGAADPQNPKAPAIPWTALQRRRATPHELRDWFESGVGRGLGIVCGPVSRLAVLDLDDRDAARAFATGCPRLLDTLTVRSGGRGQPHYYFEVPAGVKLRGARAPGVDLQYEGTYVLAPPTRFASQRWQVSHEVEPLRLDQAGADELLRFLELWRLRCEGGPPALLQEELKTETALVPTLDGAALCGWYRKLARRSGRNRALYRAAGLARACGWNQAQAAGVLVAAHVAQPPSWPHAPETPLQRTVEARRTIASAWRRPQPVMPGSSGEVKGLPNVLRESLLARYEVALARVLEGLRLVHVRAGRLLDECGMCQLLEPLGIGRRSVQRALRARLPGDLPVFESPRNPPKGRANAACALQGYPPKCDSVRGAGRVKKGRPSRLYRVPALATLLATLKLKDDGGDPLSTCDLRSPRAYRCALHRALIARRPGCYSRQWLGARLGVSVWTSRRYDRCAGLKVQARYLELELGEQDLERLPQAQQACDGRFLLSGDGRRWPPLRSLAPGLLQRYRRLRYLRQGWNYYELALSVLPAALHAGSGMSSRLHPGPLGVAQNGGHQRHQRELSGRGFGSTEGQGPHASRASPREGCDRLRGKDGTVCEDLHNLGFAESDAGNGEIASEAMQQSTTAMRYWHCQTCGRGGFCERTPEMCPACGAAGPDSAEPEIWRDAGRCRAWWGSRQGAVSQTAERAAPQAEERDLALARQLCQVTRRRNRKHALSMATALQLLDECGAGALRRALRLLERRRDVRNPGGFVVTLVRGSRRSGNGERRSQEDWLAALRSSPWADLIET